MPLRAMAVMTSGGDSQGMNSTLRAVVRTGLRYGCKVYFVREGYEGLINGKIEEASWFSVSNIIHMGGTMIGSARSEEFQRRDGRKKAAEKLFSLGIFHLICIGGDGSLTGLNLFKDEWPEFCKELLADRVITAQQAEDGGELRVVGLVGLVVKKLENTSGTSTHYTTITTPRSIDNDFIGTDRTIGSDTAMARIMESVDAVSATASSHQRTFIIEVMGRNCGHLALTTAIAVEADFVFIPEIPPAADWPHALCEQLSRMRKLGRRFNIIILSEGAIDDQREKITAEQIKKIIVDTLKYDTRITQLGHVQRGGTPTFLDRMLGCRMGYEAVKLLVSDTNDIPQVICLKGHTLKKMPLLKAVSKTRRVSQEVIKGEYDLAAKLRGEGFVEKTDFIQFISDSPDLSFVSVKRFAVIHVGAPVAGMNSVTHAFTRIANHSKVSVIGVEESWDGFKQKRFKDLNWAAVSGWMGVGGSRLGSKKQLPTDLPRIADVFKEMKIDGLLIVGGFEAFHSALILKDARDQFPVFSVPIVVVPATISNNVPGTCISLGSDTAMNEICRQVDNIKQSARGTKHRAMIVETMGGRCGYLAAMTALATGADAAIVKGNGDTEEDIKKMAEDALMKKAHGVEKYLVVRGEGANDGISARAVKDIFDAKCQSQMSTRVNVLAHSQEGGAPSAFDRQIGLRSGIRAFEGMFNPKKMGNNDACVLGLVGRRLRFSSIARLSHSVCFEHRLSLDLWWMDIIPLIDHLSGMDESTPAKVVESVRADWK